MRKDNYTRLAISLAISFIIMYSVMFMNVDSTSHIYLSLTRFYMSLMMVSPMALLMLLLMGHMYQNKKLNTVISVTGIVVFIAATTLLRTQVPIHDVQYMRAMIPHHSSAILTSKHADIQDPEVKKLSEQIISSQEREIKEMKEMLARLESN